MEFLRGAAPSTLLAQAATNRPVNPGKVTLAENERRQLLDARPGAKVQLPSVAKHTGDAPEDLQLERVDLFAHGSRIHLRHGQSDRLISAPERFYFLSTNQSTGLGLAIDPVSGKVTGYLVKAGEHLEVSGNLEQGLDFSTVQSVEEDANSCATDSGAQPGYDPLTHAASMAQSRSEAPAGSVITYQAVIAVDTDTEWMAGKSNNSTTALNWITDVFLAMNVFYERDLETRLMIGEVTLRTGTDPYSEPSNRSNQLDEFGEYWRLNMAHVDRDFATMFSGRSISSGSFSGIAWVDQYCRTGQVWGARTVGSYSFNAIGSGRTTANTALFIGHEIGHNMGSPHTHCYAPEVDRCYGGESGCYSGPVSCPVSGRGTVMSYCHFSAGSGGAACGSSNKEFHPTVQNLLKSELASNSPSCIASYTELPATAEIFKNSFE